MLLVENARAKINLGLKILGRRSDGYHEIRTIMQTVDLADTLYFSRQTGAESKAQVLLSCTEPGLSTGPDNLVFRAAMLFRERMKGTLPGGIRIHLEKRIPLGAGLGGGSADAAAALRGLNRLCGGPFDGSELRGMAACLGSDVPFMVEGGTARVGGRGEVVEPLMFHGTFFYVLVYPGVEVSTAWAYRQVSHRLTDTSSYFRFISSLKSGGCVDHDTLVEVLENDFQYVVERAYPIVATVRAHLDRAGARISTLSGSGSTVYGIFDDRNAAYQAHQELQGQGFRSFFCRPSPPESIGGV